MSSLGNPEILQIADAVSREKNIPKDSILEAMENAIQVAGRRKYGHKHNIKADIDRKSGEIKLYRVYEVIDDDSEIENATTQLNYKDAIAMDSECQIGDYVYEILPPIELGRVAAQAAKQVIVQKVKDVEREKQYEEFKDKIGEIVNGVVKRNEYGNVIVDIGRDEALIKKDQVIPGESFRQNDRIRAYIYDVKRNNKAHQILLSRTHNRFLAKLFEQEVPEIYDNIIEIKSVAREPGSRAKIAVFTSDSSLDAVGSCVGVRGARVQAVINELHGEKIDIIPWSADLGTYVMSALAPADISKVVIDEDEHKIEVVVATDQLSLAIGKKGQNVRLASELVGWKVDILTEDEESKRRTEEFTSSTQLFIESLDVEEVIAQLLTVEGYSMVEEIANADISDLAAIEGFDEELSKELISRAKSYVEASNKINIKKLQEIGFDKELNDFIDCSLEDKLVLAENGIKKIEDFAELSVKEFKNILPKFVANDQEIEALIEKAKSYDK